MLDLYANQVEGIAHEVAKHLIGAREDARALNYLVMAARVARNGYNCADAEKHRHKAEGLRDELSERLARSRQAEEDLVAVPAADPALELVDRLLDDVETYQSVFHVDDDFSVGPFLHQFGELKQPLGGRVLLGVYFRDGQLNRGCRSAKR